MRREDHRFVARHFLATVNVASVGDDGDGVRCAATGTAAQDRHPVAAAPQTRRDEGRKRRLARSTDDEVADAHDAPGQATASPNARTIEPPMQPGAAGVDPRQRQQWQQQRPA